MGKKSRARRILLRAYARVNELKYQKPLLIKESAIDESLSVISGILSDISSGFSFTYKELKIIREFGYQVIWSFQLPQPEEGMPYNSNLISLRKTLDKFRPLIPNTS